MNIKKIYFFGNSILISFILIFFVQNSKWYFEQFIEQKMLPPTKLMDDFTSFRTEAEIYEYLNLHKVEWKIVYDSTSSYDKLRPEFSEKRIRVANYRTLDTLGTLELDFNNNRLYQTTFFPSELNRYRVNFKEIFNRDFELEKEVPYDRSTIIKAIIKDQNGPRIRWYDSRIQEEISSWVDRFS